METETPESATPWREWLFPVALIGLLFALLTLLFWGAGRGFDVSDEGYYLLWAAHPDDVAVAIHLFGYYTGILYDLVDGHLMLFRVAGMLVLLASGGLFASALRPWVGAGRGRFVSFVAVVLMGALAYYANLWLLTPSYNWLALCSALWVAAGLLRATAGWTAVPGWRGVWWPGVLIGLGGGLAFMARPTAGAALALMTLLWVFSTPLRRGWLPLLSVAGLTAVGFVGGHILFAEPSFVAFYQRLKTGVALIQLLEHYDTFTLLLDLLYGLVGALERLLSDTWESLLLLMAWAFWVRRGILEGRYGTRMVAAGLALVIGVVWGQMYLAGYLKPSHLGFAGVALPLWMGGLAFTARRLLIVPVQSSPATLPLPGVIVLLVVLPLATALGTNNGVIYGAASAIVFACAAVLLLALWIDRRTGTGWMGGVTSVLLVVSLGLVVQSSFNTPYRLVGNVAEQTVPVSFLDHPGTIKVDSATADYVNRLKKMALSVGWQPGMHLIDMTGATPGATVILGGRAPGIPWLLGGRRAASTYAFEVLRRVPREVTRNAWVLVAPSGQRKLNSRVLRELGLAFPYDYETVGELTTGIRNERQVLLRPRGDTSPLADTDPQKVWTFILAGQSNMAGRGRIPAAEQGRIFANIFQIGPSGKPVPAHYPLHFGPLARYAMGVDFAKQVATDCDGCKILLVQSAMGNESIKEWDRGGKALKRIAQMVGVAQGVGTVKAVLWHQGENDAYFENGTNPQQYGKQLARNLAHIREIAGGAEIPVIVGTLPDFLADNPQFPWVAEINAGIRQVAASDPNIHLVALPDMVDKGDALHFNTDSLRLMGGRYADTFQRLMEE